MATLRLPHMPFFVSDYLGATRHMTLAERGAYTDLLFAQWNIGPLPADTSRLAAMISCSPRDFAKVWPAIRPKFVETPDGLVNQRLELHREKTIRLAEKRATAGRKGGKASAEKRQETLQ